MKLEQPFIFREGLFLREHVRLLHNFANQYNDGKKNGEMLKGEHIGLLDELIYYAHKRILHSNKILKSEGPELQSMDSNTWVKVNLSKYLIAQRPENRRHPDTVKRWKRRLIEAGAIVSDPRKFEELKIARSHRNDVLINPDLLLIYDINNPQYTPITKFFSETDKQDIWKEKRANCMGVSGKGTLQDSINNEIMTVDTVEKGVSHTVDEQQSIDPISTKPDTTPKQGAEEDNSKEKLQKNTLPTDQNAQNVQQDQNTKGSGGGAAAENINFEAQLLKKRDKVTEMRRVLAIELYTFMVQMLFKFHNIFPGEAHMAIEYLQEIYFGQVTDDTQGARAMKCYKWRVSKAASYNKRYNRDFSNVYPVRYLNINNKKGFAATKAWYTKAMRDKDRKAQTRMAEYEKIATQSLMADIMEEYRENPTVANFNRQSSWLGQEHPHMLNLYVQQVTDYNQNIR